MSNSSGVIPKQSEESSDTIEHQAGEDCRCPQMSGNMSLVLSLSTSL